MSFINDFKDFALRGNVIDLAVGIIIGAAFSNLVNSAVQDLIQPPVGLLLGHTQNLNNYYINLSGQHYNSLAQAQAAGAPVIAYGAFINTLINFIILAFVIFLIVRWITSLRKKPKQTPDTKKCPYCTLSIPKEATRCPECTAVLDGGTANEAQASGQASTS